LDSDIAFILDFRFLQSSAIYKKFLSHLLANVKPSVLNIFLIFDFVEKSLFDGLSIPASCKKNNIETGRGYWKSLAAAPLGVAACVSRQNRDFT